MAGDQACSFVSIIWLCISAVPVVSLCTHMAVMTCRCSVLTSENFVVDALKDTYQLWVISDV